MVVNERLRTSILMYLKFVFENRNESTSSAAMGAIAVKFLSPAARDDVDSSTRKLKNVTASRLFGIGGDSRIYINEILPGPVLKLAGASHAQARILNYLPPLVRQTGVYMRRKMEGALIPVTFLAGITETLTQCTLAQ